MLLTVLTTVTKQLTQRLRPQSSRLDSAFSPKNPQASMLQKWKNWGQADYETLPEIHLTNMILDTFCNKLEYLMMHLLATQILFLEDTVRPLSELEDAASFYRSIGQLPFFLTQISEK